MQRSLSFWLRGCCHAALIAVGCFLIWQATRPGPVEVTLDDKPFQVSGPYRHDNLAVYLIHSDQQDDLHYITLQEGLEKGLVKVNEKDDSTVNELQIDNQSDQHLFLQEGDRLSGGKQDRTIYASHVVPPKSGPQALPAFCIEPSRWNGSKEFKSVSNAALAPQEVRFAAKYLNDQGAVWANVAQQRAALQQNLANSPGALSYATTSLNEALDAAPIKKLSDDFAAALSDVVKHHPNAVGVAIVINGHVEEVNVYPNHGLLAKQYPRLVQSYALQAMTDQGERKGKELSPLEVARVMAVGQQVEERPALVARARATRDMDQMNGNDDIQARVQDGIRQSMDTFREGGGNDVLQEQTLSRSNRREVVILSPGAAQPQSQPARTDRTINADNRMQLFQGAGVAGGKTEYQGKTVHWQFIRRDLQPAPVQAARMAPTARDQQRLQNATNGQEQQQRDVNSRQQQVEPPAQPQAPNAPPQQ